MKRCLFVFSMILLGWGALFADDGVPPFSSLEEGQQIVVEYHSWGSFHGYRYRFVFDPVDQGSFEAYEYAFDPDAKRYRDDPASVGHIKLGAGEKKELDQLLELYRKIENKEVEGDYYVSTSNEEVTFIHLSHGREKAREHFLHNTSIIADSELINFEQMVVELREKRL